MSQTKKDKFNSVFKELETYDKGDVLWELTLLNQFCKECFSIVNRTRKYTSTYRYYLKEERFPKITLLTEFFNKVKETDVEVYNYLTEGHDMLNLKEYMAFDNLSVPKLLEKLNEFNEYLIYLTHMFKKFLNTEDEAKKLATLHYMLGL